ncbi:F-box domain [Macleaya cordata]|uniref:F-box domain n=1 Tax=Macleaya cordata TaxID=56857 RepID=A0A200PLX9_MACCD|nr:F-box domain [Macleaya cordata]
MDNLLPPDITIDIFSRLPAESVVPWKRVCTTWRRLLQRTDFADTHLCRQLQQQQQLDHQEHDHEDDLYHKGSNNGGGGGGATSKVSFLFLAKSLVDQRNNKLIYYGEYYDGQFYYKTLTRRNIGDAVDMSHHSIVGSCNGLICFSVSHNSRTNNTFVGNDPIYICNPITGEEVNLPTFINNNNNGRFHWIRMASGFGYLPSMNTYKVVRISYHSDLRFGKVGQVEVYTLGSGSGWRNKGEISYLLLHDADPSLGVLVDGALHWLDYKKLKIVAFNLEDEEFFEVPSPPCFQPADRLSFFHLQVLGGCLCVVHKKRGIRIDVWSLKKKKKKKKNSSYGTKEQDYECYWSWRREFRVGWGRKYSVKYEPFALTESGEVLFRYDRYILYVYNPKTATLKKFTTGDMGLAVFQAIPHMNSFVSLKALGERLI